MEKSKRKTALKEKQVRNEMESFVEIQTRNLKGRSISYIEVK